MHRKHSALGLIGLIGFLAASTARAEITSFTGFTETRIEQYRDGELVDTDVSSDRFPETDSTLPLQVLAQLLHAADPNDDASGGAAAAQFADPRDLAQANPEEFAINLALNSVSASVYYNAAATAQETREITYEPADFGANAVEGDTVDVTGRLFLDGALALLSIDAGRDLSEVFATVHVTVTRSSETLGTETVFSGSLTLGGASGGDGQVSADGAFPTNQLILTDLSLLSTEFDTFRVLIIPSISIDYGYQAVVGEPFTLEATIDVDAANAADNTGVAVVLGSPTDALTQVIGLTQGEAAATKTINLLKNERANPTGLPAFPSTTIAPLGLCPVAGFASLFGLCAMTLVTRRGGRRTSR